MAVHRGLKTIAGDLLLAALLARAAAAPARPTGRRWRSKFEQFDFVVWTLETADVAATNVAPPSSARRERYIALVRQYADLLGPKEAKQRRQQEADGISAYCLPCAGVLTARGERY